MLKALYNSILSLIYPRECRVCSSEVNLTDHGVACGGCWDSTLIFDGNEMLCDRCGALLGPSAGAVKVFCRRCDDHYYDKAIAVGVYEKALAACVINLKSSPVLPGCLSDGISNSVRRINILDFDLLVPIPLSKKRKLERGYNQAEVIARHIGQEFGIAIDSSSLIRKLHTPIHRVGMDQKARDLTVRNAFEVVRPRLINGKNILLIDDVLTSGSTASYCAKVLKKNGAKNVSAFTLARAVLH